MVLADCPDLSSHRTISSPRPRYLHPFPALLGPAFRSFCFSRTLHQLRRRQDDQFVTDLLSGFPGLSAGPRTIGKEGMRRCFAAECGNHRWSLFRNDHARKPFLSGVHAFVLAGIPRSGWLKSQRWPTVGNCVFSELLHQTAHHDPGAFLLLVRRTFWGARSSP